MGFLPRLNCASATKGIPQLALGVPGFGRATGFAAPRQIRFSIDFEF